MPTDFLPVLSDTHSRDGLIIAGPCSAESLDRMLLTARQLCAQGIKIFRAGTWKPRTRPGGFEGHGAEALGWLSEVKKSTGMLTATEVGCAAHVEAALEAGVDILWIGARTTVSPFAVQDIADSLRGCDVPVLIKNPSCVDMNLWIGAVERFYNSGLRRLAAVHRGFKIPGETSYRNAPLWELVAEFRKELPGLPIICDPSHMGGARQMILPLSARARELGYDGLIIESHCDPDSALTDSFQQILPSDIKPVMDIWKGCAAC